jgi:hypothetical protein
VYRLTKKFSLIREQKIFDAQMAILFKRMLAPVVKPVRKNIKKKQD